MKNKISYYLQALQNSFHGRWILANLLCRLLPDFFSGVFRARVYRLAGLKIGYGCFIMSNMELLSGLSGFYDKLEVGKDCLISSHVTINLDDKVTIGENVTIGPFVKIYTGSHKMGSSSRRCSSELSSAPVIIGAGSWVAMSAVILPGVNIGTGCVVAAGSVVTKDIPANSYVAGVPAIVQRQLT